MFVLSKIKGWLLGLGAAVVVALGIYMKGRSDKAEDTYREELENYKDTRNRIDEAVDPNSTYVDSVDWLRSRNKQ